MNYVMSSRKNNRKKKSKFFQIILVIVALILSIYLLASINFPIISEIAGFIVNTTSTIVESIRGVITQGTDYFGNVKNLNEENQKLNEENQKLKVDLLEIDKLIAENNELKEAVDIDEKYNHFNKIYANVILREYSNWNETFVINKGKTSGIKEKQTVISSNGLVGYISTVTENTSVVTTILDPSTSVSVEIATINELALAKGDFTLKDSEQLKLTNAPIDCELTVGEKIYTSGIGTMYQKGILIGEIKEVVNKKNDIDRYAIITPFTNFNSLDLVAVIVE
ncbi:MAG: rod shape-determining protein MreC [Clostridia bacterium]|nr:rod shape-determining protein MreC [Clostridia bacterium]